MYSDDKFYNNLQGFTSFNNYTRSSEFQSVPDDWLVAVADVENSTMEIKSGRYREVNAVGAATIAAVVNNVKAISIPFVFGGDGAVFCFPLSYKDKVSSALLASEQLAKVDFSMNLRTGIVPVAELRKRGTDVKTAKYQPLKYYQQAMFSGNGISLAEDLVKADDAYKISRPAQIPEGDFTGFECRWDEIPSPHEETISIIIKSLLSNQLSERLYSDINIKLNEIYGEEYEHHPIRKESLSLSFSLRKLCSEAAIRTRLGSNLRRLLYTLKLIVLNSIGKWFMHKGKKTKYTDWGKYKDRLITNTDYRKFDDTLRMVISGSPKQREKLLDYFNLLREKREIAFGIHVSQTSLVTCLVENYETEHVHFLDGSNGGYAFAALQLKEQLAGIDS